MNIPSLRTTFLLAGLLSAIAVVGGRSTDTSGDLRASRSPVTEANTAEAEPPKTGQTENELIEQVNGVRLETNRRLSELVGKVAALESRALDEARRPSDDRLGRPMDGSQLTDANDEDQQLQTRLEEQTRLFDEALHYETRAPAAEASLAEAFTADEIKGLVLNRSHCGETLCRVEVSPGGTEADYAAFDKRIQLLSHNLPWRGQGMAIITGTETSHPTGVVYLAREGQSLPVFTE